MLIAIAVDDSYCFHEPTKNAGVFGGILTSQCTEIIEYSDKDETAVCNLASIALPAFITSELIFQGRVRATCSRTAARGSKVVDRGAKKNLHCLCMIF